MSRGLDGDPLNHRSQVFDLAFPHQLKQPADGDFTAAWGGISSLQLGISLVWTEARRRGISLDRVSDWMSARTASLAGLSSKGRIALGLDADFTVLHLTRHSW